MEKRRRDMQCFVCFEGDSEESLYSICACTDMFVHEKCLQKVLALPAHRHQCPVCSSSYAISDTTVRTCQCHPTWRRQMSCISVGFLCMICFYTLILHHATSEEKTVSEASVHLVFAFIVYVCFFTFAWVSFYTFLFLMQGYVFCLKMENTVIARTFLLTKEQCVHRVIHDSFAV